MIDPVARDSCPTCGAPVRVVSSDEGTSHYEPAGALDTHVHEWEDAPDDETGWHCPGCGSTEYPGMIDELTPRDAIRSLSPPAAPGLREAVEEAIRFLNVLGDPIAAYLTLVAALDGEYPKPKATSVVPDPAASCTCGHRRDHHINRDVDDVVGWPCLDCRSKRCRGFALAETPGEPHE
jgi:hypothetical protein